MGKITGFMELQRIAGGGGCRSSERVRHYREFILALTDDAARRSRARAAWTAASRSARAAARSTTSFRTGTISSTGSSGATRSTCCTRRTTFPEFTGRVCPAPCEASCTLNINNDPVGIKSIEHFIIDKGWEEGWVVPQPPRRKTGKRVAVVGSGPAGLACAQQLARAGHDVVLFEKAGSHRRPARATAFPISRWRSTCIDRRMAQMSTEGVEFRPSVACRRRRRGRSDSSTSSTRSSLTGGAEAPRDLPVPGRDLDGVHFAMEFLPQQNQRRRRRRRCAAQIIATGKHVVVIGGGDTGSDCVGTSNRQRRGVDHAVRAAAAAAGAGEQAARVAVLADQAAHLVVARGRLRPRLGGRDQAVRGPRRQGRKARRRARRVAAATATARTKMVEIPGSEFELKADLVLLAMGFVGPVQPGLLAAARRRATTRAATSRPTPRITGRRCRRCSPPATCGAASRSSSGRFARAASARARSTSSLMGASRACRAELQSALRAMTDIVTLDIAGWRPAPRAWTRSDAACARSKAAACSCCRSVRFALSERRARASCRRRGRTAARRTSASTGDALKGARRARPICASWPRWSRASPQTRRRW